MSQEIQISNTNCTHSSQQQTWPKTKFLRNQESCEDLKKL